MQLPQAPRPCWLKLRARLSGWMETPAKRSRSPHGVAQRLPGPIKVVEKWDAFPASAISERQRAQVTDAVIEQIFFHFKSYGEGERDAL